jgi:BirA family biotin operon repressor/biotin-[acetyl-CoA-carboxylase] ligase
MLNGRKLGGILIEGADRTADLIAVGLGLSVANCPTGLPAASLSENGIEISVREILEAVCLSVDHWYRLWCREGFAPVRQQWLADAYGLEDTMQVRFPDGSEAAGIFSGIDPNGALLLGQPDGETRCIATGEVFFASA